MLVAWFALFAASAWGAASLRFSNHPLDWFDPDEPMRIATELLNDALGGAQNIEVVVDSGREAGLYDPELLHRIEALESHAEGFPVGDLEIGRAKLSPAQVVKEIHQALDAGNPDSWKVPDDAKLVAQELLLFELSGSDDLEDVVDTTFRLGRVSLPVPMVDAVLYVPVLDQLRIDFGEILGETDFELTGHFALAARTTNALIESLANTYLLAFTLIAPFMVVLLGSLRTGLLSMLPAVGSILVTLGFMAALGLPLDPFTLLVGSIALGLAVDDTIHFMHNYSRARERGDDVETAIRKTLADRDLGDPVADVLASVDLDRHALGDREDVRMTVVAEGAGASEHGAVANHLVEQHALALGRRNDARRRPRASLDLGAEVVGGDCLAADARQDRVAWRVAAWRNTVWRASVRLSEQRADDGRQAENKFPVQAATMHGRRLLRFVAPVARHRMKDRSRQPLSRMLRKFVGLLLTRSSSAFLGAFWWCRGDPMWSPGIGARRCRNRGVAPVPGRHIGLPLHDARAGALACPYRGRHIGLPLHEVRGGALACPLHEARAGSVLEVAGRRHGEAFAKALAEIAQALEADGVADFRHVASLGAQQLRRAHQPHVANQLVG